MMASGTRRRTREGGRGGEGTARGETRARDARDARARARRESRCGADGDARVDANGVENASCGTGGGWSERGGSDGAETDERRDERLGIAGVRRRRSRAARSRSSPSWRRLGIGERAWNLGLAVGESF